MNITIQQEAIADIWWEAKPLLEAHWREIAHYQDIPLQPDWEFYRTSPFLRCFTVRADGVLVGYDVLGVARNKHYLGSLQAVQDVIFLLPEHRNRNVGASLVAFGDQALKAEGVQVVYRTVKKAHAALGVLLAHAGYDEVDIVKAKRLDRE